MSSTVPKMASTMQRGLTRQQVRNMTAAKPVVRASMMPMMSSVGQYPFSSTNKMNGFKQAAGAASTTGAAKRADIGMSMNSKKTSINMLMGKKFVNGAKPFGSMASPQTDMAKDLGMRGSAAVMGASAGAWDQQTVEKLEAASKKARIVHLEQQAMDAIQQAVDSGAQVVFPNALIAGDVVLTHLISRLGLFENIPVLFINTLHLFEETLDFIEEIEGHYGFQGHVSMAEGITGDRYTAKE
jgi:hypothetical protein